MTELTENELILKKEIDDLKAEVKSLKEFVRALYAMINDDDEEYSSDYAGGAEVGRFNT